MCKISKPYNIQNIEFQSYPERSHTIVEQQDKNDNVSLIPYLRYQNKCSSTDQVDSHIRQTRILS